MVMLSNVLWRWCVICRPDFFLKGSEGVMGGRERGIGGLKGRSEKGKEGGMVGWERYCRVQETKKSCVFC